MSITKKRSFTYLLLSFALLTGGTGIWYFGRQFTEQAALEKISRALGDLRGANTRGYVLDWAERTSVDGDINLRGVTLRQNGVEVLIAESVALHRDGLSLTLRARNITLLRNGSIARTHNLNITGLRHRFLRAATSDAASLAEIAASLDGVGVQIEQLELAAPEYAAWSQTTARWLGFTVDDGKLHDLRVAGLAAETATHNSALTVEKAVLDGVELTSLLSAGLPQTVADATNLLHGASIGADRIRLATGPATANLATLSAQVSGPYLRNLQMHTLTVSLNNPDDLQSPSLRRMAQSGQPAQIALFTLDQINTEQLGHYVQKPEIDFNAATVLNSGFDVHRVQALNVVLPQILSAMAFEYTRTPDHTENVQVNHLNLDLTTLAADNAAIVATLPALTIQELNWRTKRSATGTRHRLQARAQQLGVLDAAVILTNLDFSTSGVTRPDTESAGRVDYSMRLTDRGLIDVTGRMNRQSRVDLAHRIGPRLKALLTRDGTVDLIGLPDRISAFIQTASTPLQFSLSLRMQDNGGALSVQRIRITELSPDAFD